MHVTSKSFKSNYRFVLDLRSDAGEQVIGKRIPSRASRDSWHQDQHESNPQARN